MFLYFAYGNPPAGIPGNNPADIFDRHPMELAELLEYAWNTSLPPPPPPIVQRPAALAFPLPALPPLNIPANFPLGHHLIYAYLIENTRACEIFERVIYLFTTGESLGFPIVQNAQRWLRNTEEVFFRHPPSFSFYNVTSDVRPDIRATRRNAYYRMFGFDLNHGTSDNRPYPYEKAAHANREFVELFEELLREAWIGYVNFNNIAGENKTDDQKIARLATQLQDILTVRRMGLNLTREEFFAVCTMEWFHLTLLFNSEIVNAIGAQASNPQERLKKVGVRVGLPAHGKSEQYFELAIPMSNVLRAIEAGTGTTAATAPIFYASGLMQQDMLTIITHWSLGTGRNLKVSRQVAVGAR